MINLEKNFNNWKKELKKQKINFKNLKKKPAIVAILKERTTTIIFPQCRQ